ncbi:MAG: DegQ family serine endoprotease [Deltaproteobacteria bacterium]|nr:DegQ family serine endoprotease [Deltaproteobacteria bacterium]
MVGLALVFVRCGWLEEKLPESWNQSSGVKSSVPKDLYKNGNAEEAPLVPWKGNAIASNTFIEISKRADLGIVNIGTTKIMQGQQNPFGNGNPFGDFFGDDLFRHFFGNPGGRGQQQPKEFKQQSLGSGFIISEDGYIVTNNHVIDQADEIKVTIGKDKEYIAKVVGTDPKTDVALIKIDAKEKLHALAMGDSDDLEVGEIVVAIGNPFGLSHTVTQGIVSAKERTIGFGPYDNFIQTDASINPGNSGGPLLNLKAEVVGINTAIHATGQGIGFAIPINLAKNIIPQLEQDGAVTRGWLGVYIQPIEENMLESLGLSSVRGALVAKVQVDSPADKAGIEPGDVILKVDGKKITKSADLPKLIANIPVGEKTVITLMRNKKEKDLTVIVGKLEDDDAKKVQPDAGKKIEKDKLGMIVSPLSDEDRKAFGLANDTQGLVIRSIEPGSPVQGRGIQVGDLIQELNQQKVPDLATYEKIMQKMDEKSTVMLKVIQKDGGRLFVIFPLS